MKAYIVHNKSNSTVNLRSRLFPKEVISLKKDAHHMFKSEQEFLMYRDVVNIFREQGLLKLEVEGDIKKSMGVPVSASKTIDVAPVEKVTSESEEKSESSNESIDSLKLKLSELQSEYKEANKERKSEIKKEVNELKKAINALRN